MFLNFLQVLGSSIRLPVHPQADLASSLHLLLLPGLWEGCLLEGKGTEGGGRGKLTRLPLLLVNASAHQFSQRYRTKLLIQDELCRKKL